MLPEPAHPTAAEDPGREAVDPCPDSDDDESGSNGAAVGDEGAVADDEGSDRSTTGSAFSMRSDEDDQSSLDRPLQFERRSAALGTDTDEATDGSAYAGSSTDGDGDDDDASVNDLMERIAEQLQLVASTDSGEVELERLQLAQQLMALASENKRDQDVPPCKPSPDSFFPAETLVEHFSDRSARLKAQRSSAGEPCTMLLCAAPKRAYSAASLADLVRVDFKALTLRKQQLGSYLLLRVVTRPIRTSGVVFIGQDPEGTACTVQTFNMPWALGASADELEAILPKGSLVACKEPFLRDDARGDVTLQIHSPTDLVLLAESVDGIAQSIEWHGSVLVPSQRPPRRTPKAWKTIGGAYLAKGWLRAAERAFTLGLQLDATHASLRLARSAVRLQLDRPRSALNDAEIVLAGDRSSYSAALLQRALFATAEAAYALQLWPLAQERLEQIKALVPEWTEVQQALERVAARRYESATGDYDWHMLYTSTQAGSRPDLADFVSDVVAIADASDGWEHGLVVTRDVAAGTLLMMVKPFAVCDADELDQEVSPVKLNMHNHAIESATVDGLTAKIAARLIDDPSMADVFDTLCAGLGNEPPTEVKIADLAPKTDVGQHQMSFAVNPSRVELVRTLSQFRLRPPQEICESDLPPADLNVAEPSGASTALYALPSFIKHSCSPNAFWQILGDALFVRATADLNAGEQVFISHLPNSAPLELDERCRALGYRGIHGCSCWLCAEELKDPREVRLNRTQLCQWSISALEYPAGDPAEDPAAWEEAYAVLDELIDQSLIKTYRSDHDPLCRVAMWALFEKLALIAHYLARRHPDLSVRRDWADDALAAGRQALISLGIDVRVDAKQVDVGPPHVCFDLAIKLCLLLAGTCKAMGDDATKAAWCAAARRLSEISVGGGLFLCRFSDNAGSYGLTADDIA